MDTNPRTQNHFRWPGDARIAISIVLNVEEWTSEGPSPLYFPLPPGSKTARDTATVTDHDYGYRAGIWRLLEILDRYEVKTTVWTSGLAAELHPAVIRQIHDAGHEIGGHGYDKSFPSVLMDREEEKADILKTVQKIEKATQQAPIGWMSPSMRSGENTLPLLIDNGFLYHSDTIGHDLPFMDTVGDDQLLAVPYSLLNNDYRFYSYGDPPLTPEEAFEWLKGDFDQLYEEGETFSQMMSYGIHPYVTGRPGRARSFERFIRYAKGFPGVWFARRDDIAQWWLENHSDTGREG